MKLKNTSFKNKTFLLKLITLYGDHLIVQLEKRSEMTKQIFELFKHILPNLNENTDNDPELSENEKLVGIIVWWYWPKLFCRWTLLIFIFSERRWEVKVCYEKKKS